MKQILLLLSIFISLGLSAQPKHPNSLDTATGLWAWGNIIQDEGFLREGEASGDLYYETIAKDQHDTIISNLEYVTVRYATGDRKLYHVMFLIKRGKEYFYPNMYPVLVKNYKQKDSAEVIVKK